jgi:hypothetical protein
VPCGLGGGRRASAGGGINAPRLHLPQAHTAESRSACWSSAVSKPVIRASPAEEDRILFPPYSTHLLPISPSPGRPQATEMCGALPKGCIRSTVKAMFLIFMMLLPPPETGSGPKLLPSAGKYRALRRQDLTIAEAALSGPRREPGSLRPGLGSGPAQASRVVINRPLMSALSSRTHAV